MNNNDITKEEFPRIPKNLLATLNYLYPERSASPEEDLKDIYFTGGQRDVIRRLNEMYKLQTGKDI